MVLCPAPGLGAPQPARIDAQPIGQPGHRHRQCPRHLVRHEPQPRQRAQRHRQAEPIRRPTPPARIDERDIGRGQGEEPEQLVPADLQEPPQTLQLPVREHPRRQYDLQPAPQIPAQKSTQPYPPDFRRVLRTPLRGRGEEITGQEVSLRRCPVATEPDVCVAGGTSGVSLLRRVVEMQPEHGIPVAPGRFRVIRLFA
ncbi:hypothetical protein ACVWZ8_003909 [Arthrobacter sp. UYCu723]